MAIKYNENNRIFKLDTDNSTYLIGITPEGYVGHVYYGKRLESDAAYYLLRTDEPPFTPSVNKREKSAFLDFFPMELSCGGIGDYRESCLNIRNDAGSMGCEFFFESYSVMPGKPKLKGLPSSFGSADEVSTLEITCIDKILGLKVVLSYSVFEREDVITRNVRLENIGDNLLKIEKIYMSLIHI